MRFVQLCCTFQKCKLLTAISVRFSEQRFPKCAKLDSSCGDFWEIAVNIALESQRDRLHVVSNFGNSSPAKYTRARVCISLSPQPSSPKLETTLSLQRDRNKTTSSWQLSLRRRLHRRARQKIASNILCVNEPLR